MMISIEKHTSSLPFDLLLLADESKKAIDKYINNCEVFSVKQQGNLAGICAIQRLNTEEIELKNIAIYPRFQKMGIGKKVIHWLVEKYKKESFKSILVGTGYASIYQLLFYQKCGFEMSHLKKNFFLENSYSYG